MSSLAADLKRRLPQPQRSLVGRLVWLAAVWCLIALLVTGVALSVFFERAATSRFDAELSQRLDLLYSGTTVEKGTVFAPVLTDPNATRPFSGAYWQLGEVRGGAVHALPDARSRSMWDEPEDLPVPASTLAKLRSLRDRGFYNAGWHGQRLRIGAMMRVLQDRAAPVVFLSAEDRSGVDHDERTFALTTAAALVLLGFGLVAAVILQVRVGLVPLFAMGREVARVRTGGAERLTGDYPRELAPLAGELNALLDHNHEVVERQRTHVGNLAHALKTPITVMLSEAAAPSLRFPDVVRRQAEAMRGQVEHHLRRARAAARSTTSGERTPVAPVLDELARTLDRVYGGRGVDIAVELEEDASAALVFLGERQDLLEMAGNLMENACKYCRGQVSVTAGAAGEAALRLAIADDGPGLKPEQREAAIRRGQRLDESAPGSGLGLSIVDELARAYGGALTLDHDAELGGLRAELRLPRAVAS